MHRRVQAAAGMGFEMVRLAIHAEDIARFKLPPQEIKDRDVRAAAFRRELGNTAAPVELEALPVAELKRRIVEAVTSLVDFDRWNRQVEVQRVELNCIAKFAERMKNLPQLGRCCMTMPVGNYNDPDMGPTRARKEHRDLEEMHWWLDRIDSEARQGGSTIGGVKPVSWGPWAVLANPRLDAISLDEMEPTLSGVGRVPVHGRLSTRGRAT